MERSPRVVDDVRLRKHRSYGDKTSSSPVRTLRPPRENRRCLPRASGAKLARRNQGRERGMLLVTGGAGFIGSNAVAALNDAGPPTLLVRPSWS